MTIKTTSLSKGVAKVEPVVLSEEPMSRLVFDPIIHNQGVKGSIVRQRRESNTDQWISDGSINIRKLQKNEGLNFKLNTEATKKLFNVLKKLYRLLKDKGVESGENQYPVSDPEDILVNDKNSALLLKKLIEYGISTEMLESIFSSNASLSKHVLNMKILSEREQSLNEFKQNLDKSQSEIYWQKFFLKNPWIFGYGFNLQFLNILIEQPTYKGPSYDGTGAQKGDYLASTEANCRFTVLIEIKKPDTKLIEVGDYRSSTSKLNKELIWAVSQVQVNCKSWAENGSKNPESIDSLDKNNIFTVEPKGILVIGNTNQIKDDRNKRETFELFRRNLHNPDIITYDELYERARFIVYNKKGYYE
ncbi:MAG: DUF4263 domain-containing protein [Caldisericia bacterium]|nr:DUF4263 domain-containing protein [Caldisericia bacterium]